MTIEPNSFEKALERLVEDAERNMEKYQELRSEIPALRATARSADDSVTVTVAPGGVVTDIHLTESALRHGTRGLSELLMSCIRTASADVSRQMADLVQDITPPGMDIASMMRSHLPASADGGPR
ncbi:YbaB/EbfC family nucleoid-associated protein [Actinomadura harenae]|uniref:YbaB/EbfC family DNA-binding protein n=1 Tax=Actinomadura harenae TaxID=2483351 RepID=A0A3M2LH96_9ACTN|nr:YbaB/EbfC family nucleoid-associated protein [Actinomadura harenae]RMI36862.1 YbaB/EbfC family DNA-binding protein [Actinomadura harenae]